MDKGIFSGRIRGGAMLLILMAFIFSTAFQLQKQPYEVLKKRFESGKILHAQFEYRYKDSFTHETSTNSGTLWISGEQYKIISPPQTILVDGETSKVYDARRNRVIISKYVEEEDDFAPSRILNGIDSTYTVAEQRATAQGYAVILRAQDPFSLYKEITITLDKNYVPEEIIAVDRANNVITTTFSDALYIKNNGAVFDITYPEDVKIVDLRN